MGRGAGGQPWHIPDRWDCRRGRRRYGSWGGVLAPRPPTATLTLLTCRTRAAERHGGARDLTRPHRYSPEGPGGSRRAGWGIRGAQWYGDRLEGTPEQDDAEGADARSGRRRMLPTCCSRALATTTEDPLRVRLARSRAGLLLECRQVLRVQARGRSVRREWLSEPPSSSPQSRNCISCSHN